MMRPKVDPKDIKEIKDLISDLFIRSPRNGDGTMRRQQVFSEEESGVLVDKVLSELGRRGYAVAKLEEEKPDAQRS